MVFVCCVRLWIHPGRKPVAENESWVAFGGGGSAVTRLCLILSWFRIKVVLGEVG